jgi:enoyl-CoA hydratase
MSRPGLPLLSVDDGRATLTLNRPAHHNRLHPEDLRAMLEHFAALAADPTLKLLVLTATGASFCSGFHLGAFDDSGSAASAGPQLFERCVDALEALPVPTICRFNGSVYGGATDIGLACDFRVGVDTMTLRMPAARLGLHYYPSGLRRYVTRLGLGTAKRLFLLADTVPAAQLLALGYLDSAVPAHELDAAVARIADALAAGAPLAVRGMKTSLDEIARGDYDLARLRAREAVCAASDDLREGMAAFAAKRQARFVGR